MGRVILRWVVHPSDAQFVQKSPLRSRFMMRKIALTLALLAVAAVAVMILVVMFTSQNS